MSTNNARRCSNCDEDWPMHLDFLICPLCSGDTWPHATAVRPQPTDAKAKIAEHKKRLAHTAHFEVFYADQAVRELGEEIDEWGVIHSYDRVPPTPIHRRPLPPTPPPAAAAKWPRWNRP